MRNIILAISAWLTSDKKQSNPQREIAYSRADAKPLDFTLHLG